MKTTKPLFKQLHETQIILKEEKQRREISETLLRTIIKCYYGNLPINFINQIKEHFKDYENR